MTSPAIGANKLTLTRENTTILDAISIDIPAGSVVGLVGRNGAGKSSLLRCLAGLVEPDSGSSSLLGCPSLELSDAVRARLGYVAQAPDLFEWMNVYEHLCLVGRAYPTWDEQRCLVLAARFELPLGKAVRELSGGDQQKMAVVLALAHDPDLLLLDEPVSSLDPLARQEFMRAMFGARAEHRERTIIVSSHILTDLERVVSHVAFMRRGALQLFDTWDAMLEYLRLAPVDTVVPDKAIICRAAGAPSMVIDIRHAPGAASAGKVMTLTELFAELNK